MKSVKDKNGKVLKGGDKCTTTINGKLYGVVIMYIDDIYSPNRKKRYFGKLPCWISTKGQKGLKDAYLDPKDLVFYSRG